MSDPSVIWRAAGPPRSGRLTLPALGLVDQSIESATSTVVIDDLYRMADMEILDLNGDDRLDFIVCGFGYVDGERVLVRVRSPMGGYRQHILIDRAGGSRVQVADLNDDQWLDIVVLVSEGREGLYVLENDGRNEFELRTIFETQPAYGHTTFELQDFNDDGLLDALVVNGDNVDSDSVQHAQELSRRTHLSQPRQVSFRGGILLSDVRRVRRQVCGLRQRRRP